MKLSILVLVFTSAYGIGNPFTIDPKKYEKKVWEFVTEINEDRPDTENFIIPIKVTDAMYIPQKNLLSLTVTYGESNCSKYAINGRSINSKKCQTIPNSSQFIYKLRFTDKLSVEHLRTIPFKDDSITTETPSSTAENIVWYDRYADKSQQLH